MSDLDFACGLFEKAIDYQKSNGYPSYVAVDRDSFIADIKAGRHFKIMEGEEVTCTFSLHDSDEPVWRAMDKEPAIYLHKATVNPDFKGRDMLKSILDYTVNFCRERNIPRIRLDTWGDNVKLRDYYVQHGFRIVEYYQTPDTVRVNCNTRGNRVVLMELKVEH